MTLKVSFKTMPGKVDAPPPSKELDFLFEWRWPDSKRNVLSITSPNITDPLRSLRGEWEELKERFSCAEMIQ